jgi:uncharacterized integral membrane protein
MQFYIILTIAFALIVAVFAIQNSTSVPIQFLVWRFEETPLVLVILSSVGLGAVIIWMLNAYKEIRNKLKFRELRHEIKKLEEENKLLKESDKDLREQLENALNQKHGDNVANEAIEQKDGETGEKAEEMAEENTI